MMFWIYRPFRGRLAALFLFTFFSGVVELRAQQADSAPTTELATAAVVSASAEMTPQAPEAQTGSISGTVNDAYGDVVVGATVKLEDGRPADVQTAEANDNGQFQFAGLKPGVTYTVTVSGTGFVSWKSQAIVLKPGETFTVTGVQLKLPDNAASVTVYADTAAIATEQVNVEYHQKVLGFIPNFYVVYNSADAVPMTAKLKFQMAFKTMLNPVTFGGVFFLGAVNQAADTPNYPQGWKGYGERVGAGYADGFTDIMFGGAILPVLLKQDPRYYYMGTGTHKQRLMHALSYPFICRGDNGKLQPNYSTMGGDLISASLSNIYYPPSNRGAGLVFTNFAVGTATRGVSTILQEFVLRKLTPAANKKAD